MFAERPISWSHLIEAEKQVINLVVGDWDWPSPERDETSALLVFRPGAQPKVRAIRDWLHDTYIGECTLLACFTDGEAGVQSRLPLAARFRFPSFDDKLLFTLRWL